MTSGFVIYIQLKSWAFSREQQNPEPVNSTIAMSFLTMPKSAGRINYSISFSGMDLGKIYLTMTKAVTHSAVLKNLMDFFTKAKPMTFLWLTLISLRDQNFRNYSAVSSFLLNNGFASKLTRCTCCGQVPRPLATIKITELNFLESARTRSLCVSVEYHKISDKENCKCTWIWWHGPWGK